MLKKLSWITFVLAIGCVLGLAWPMLYKLGLRSCFLGDWDGFWESATQVLPGGVLQWMANGLMGLWKVPLLGVASVVILGIAIVLLGWKWGKQSRWTAVLPLALVTWQLMLCGFSVWVFKNAAFPAIYLLGWALLFFTLGFARRYGLWALIVGCLYPWVGMPAVYAMVAVAFAAHPRPLAYWQRFCFFLMALLPLLGVQLVAYANPSLQMLLEANSLLLLETGSVAWDVVTVLMFALILWGDRLALYLPEKLQTIGSILILPCYIVAVCLVSDPLPSVWAVLRAERNFSAGDTKALAEIPEHTLVKHRMLAAYRIYGLWRRGQLAERLFDAQPSISHERTSIQTMEFDGYRLLYAYGLVLQARRMCFESLTNKGWSGEKYDLMARIAYLCNEPVLAQKYAQQLARIPFWKQEAKQLLNGELSATDRHVGELFARLSRDSACPTFASSVSLEEQIYNRYAVLKNGNLEMVELYLCASLLQRNTVPFLENYDTILQVWSARPLPKVFQEALLAAASTRAPEEQPPLTQSLFSPGVIADFATFQHAVPALVQNDRKFRQKYLHTYWFYSSYIP